MLGETHTRRRFPFDVYIVGAGILAAVLGGLLSPGSSIRLALTVPLLVVLPGYALTTVLFPANRSQAQHTERRPPDPQITSGRVAGLSPLERAAAAFGLSVALVPLFGLLLVAVGVDLGFASLVPTLGGVTAVLMAVGVRRRHHIPTTDQWDLPIDRGIAYIRAIRAEPVTIDSYLHAFLAMSIIAAVLAFGVATVAPQDGASYTEFALLTEGDDGRYVATGYPTTLRAGESQDLVFSVNNQETEEITYSIVVVVRRVEASDVASDTGLTTVEKTRLDTFRETVPDGETLYRPHEVTVPAGFTGSDLRLTYLLYRGEPPSQPTTTNAYRTLQISVDVSAGPSS